MTEEIARGSKNDECSVGIYVDLQKAFHTMDDTRLLRKLEKYGNTRHSLLLARVLFTK